MVNLPDITEDGVVIHNPEIVASNSDSSIDLNYISQSLRKFSTDTTGSDAETETTNLSETTKININNNDSNKLQVQLPPDFRSNSMPSRLSKEQRPSVIDRISKEASNRFHKLYYRTISVESTGNLCGCCFWRKRESVDSFGVSINVSDATLSNILGGYYRDRSDSDDSVGFHNPNFHDQQQQPQSECSTTNTKNVNINNNSNNSISNLQNTGKYLQRSSELRHKVSDIVADVIIEEIDEVVTQSRSPVRLFCQREGRETSASLIHPALIKSETISCDNIRCYNSNSIFRSKSSEFITDHVTVLSDSQVEKKKNHRRIGKRRRSKSMSCIDSSHLHQHLHRSKNEKDYDLKIMST